MDLREHDNVVECIEWAPDSAIENIQKGANLDSKNKSGPFLVSGSRDKTIKVSFLILIDQNIIMVLISNNKFGIRDYNFE